MLRSKKRLLHCLSPSRTKPFAEGESRIREAAREVEQGAR